MLFPMFMLDICCQRSLYTCLIFSAFTTATCIHACIPLWVRRSSNLKFLLCISYVVKADAWKSKTSKAGCYVFFKGRLYNQAEDTEGHQVKS